MLVSVQLDGLRRRFPLFQEAACAAYFAAEQPIDGNAEHDGVLYPAIVLANGATWFYEREARPVNAETGQPLKVRARKGYRVPLVDDLEQADLLLVEGEGHGCAALSVGLHGVVVVGGTQGFLAAGGAEKRRRIFEGKTVRVLFDNDLAGEQGAAAVAREALECGAARAAVVRPPFPAGQDVEDWLRGFESAERGLGELLQVLGAIDWAGAAEALVEHPRVPVQAQTVVGRDGRKRVAISVWDETTETPALAVLGVEEGEVATESVANDTVAGPGFIVVEEWTFEGRTYEPDMRGDMRKQIQVRALIPPAPPMDPGTSEDLWRGLVAFLQRWVAIEPRYYDVMASYVFMTYRLHDAGFDYVPYIRFFGPPGAGKGRACDAMRVVCFRGYSAKPTKNNLHRVIDYLGDLTLVIDEFHLDRGRGDQNEEMIDLLNFGNKASELVLRMQPDGRGKDMTVRAFSLFGPKILAGYGTDEHEALARRSISIEMGAVPVPESARWMNLPPAFYAEAFELRRRLLGWRAKKLALGKPTNRAREGELLRRAGHAVGQSFWPLVEMVPDDERVALENLMLVAEERRDAARQTREASTDSYLVEAFVRCWTGGKRRPVAGYPAGWAVVALSDLTEALGKGGPQIPVSERARAAGLRHARPAALDSGQQIGGIVASESPDDLVTPAALARYGIAWPPKKGDASPI